MYANTLLIVLNIVEKVVMYKIGVGGAGGSLLRPGQARVRPSERFLDPPGLPPPLL